MKFVHKIFENSLPQGRIFVRPKATGRAKGKKEEEKMARRKGKGVLSQGK